VREWMISNAIPDTARNDISLKDIYMDEHDVQDNVILLYHVHHVYPCYIVFSLHVCGLTQNKQENVGKLNFWKH